MKYAITFFYTLFALTNLSKAQTNNLKSPVTTNWKTIITMELDTTAINIARDKNCLGGESRICKWKKVWSIDDLSKHDLRKIKKFAAKYSGQIVYVDIKHIIAPEYGEKCVYYIWTICK